MEGFFICISSLWYLLYTPNTLTALHSTFSIKIILLAASVWHVWIKQKHATPFSTTQTKNKTLSSVCIIICFDNTGWAYLQIY
jgi:hypothetical protein